MRTYLRRLLVFVALTAIVCVRGLANPPEMPAAQGLSTLVERFAKAQQNFDVPTLSDLTTEDYVEVSPLGEVDSRDRMLSSYAPEHKVDPPKVSIQETQARVFGETGVVLARLKYTMKGWDDQPRTSDLRATFVARKTPTGWKLTSTSYTPVRPAQSK